ncbi:MULTISPECIES: helix-turn-helix domain-containing protein [unclassified Nocardioides]|uniref:helix-turn-helix domain-containing protein n=1 Tax=unclassified Nocardioides TaxID=2615069 RepID=UPI000702C8E2|nr:MULTISPECIES: cupin domain-containing protein [unclassified Nocardioides]KQZ70111.1 hypothetical protein ASD66_10595 [Nocardioides sp. Root151]KRF16208.1 hypothetical protein ASH02_06360 [Nocardioides sp. Soil796]
MEHSGGATDAAHLTDHGALDDDLLGRLGGRVRELRAGKSMTVQQLAERSGISRRLMTQIELGQANPSLVTVTRIARQLDTDFAALVAAREPEQPITVHGGDAHVLVWTGEPGSAAHLLESADERVVDLWRWRLVPGDSYRGHADPARSQELFYVLKGELTVFVDDQRVVIRAGESALLRSDRPYSYENSAKTPVEFVRSVLLST